MRGDEVATVATIYARPLSTVPEVDKVYAVTSMLAEFKALQAGNTVRFGLGLGRWSGWPGR